MQIKVISRLNHGSTKNDQNYTHGRLNIRDIRTDLNFFVTSSRPIKEPSKVGVFLWREQLKIQKFVEGVTLKQMSTRFSASN